MLLNCAGVTLRDLQKVFPSWRKAQCQDHVVVKPTNTQQKERETFKNSASHLIRKMRRSVLLFLQFLKLSLLFGPLLVLYPVTLLSGRLYSVWLNAFFYVVEFSGPVYIKLGQWASTRRDLFSAEFCELFSQLHHSVRPHDWYYTERALRTAYGKRWYQVLKIDKNQKPLGSGCVAQVYKGYIHTDDLPQETLEAMSDTDELDDLYFKDGVEIQNLMDTFSISDDSDEDTRAADPGEDTPFADNPDYIPVAVKVLHPGIHERFSNNLVLMSMVAGFLEFVIPSLRWVNLTDCVREFSVAMMKQMDMIHEARCLKRFYADFADVTSVRIPVPIMGLLRRNILVESFEDGQPIHEFLQETEDTPKGLRERLAEIGVDALLQMVFVKNFVHGDLHPGNILVQNAEAFQEQTEESSLVMLDVGDVIVTTVASNPCPLRLVLLDCGITASLGAEDRTKFNQVFTAVVKGEGEVVADLFLEKSHHVECTDPEAFRKDMVDLVNKARETTLQLSKIKVSVLLSDVFSVLSKHRVKLESNFATIILAIAILEGLGRSLDPDLDILSKAKGVLLGKMVQRLR
ncbi:hypothetical protein V1264_003757 [Littorina saxatilis]|uniref:ABC1 atypical kinase-like domain-containing protein n=2 Tax=Littorina saxatilis TaxID=31220 RepID=A0AAN9B142_9CAEN